MDNNSQRATEKYVIFDTRKCSEININSILDDPREELLYDIQPEGLNIKTTRCPERNILLENIKVKALIDTGSEISCISEEIYATRPTLPISGKIIKGATGEKSTRLKFQVLLSTKISTLETKLICIVVPKLVKNCILGYDSQKALNMLTFRLLESLYIGSTSDMNFVYS